MSPRSTTSRRTGASVGGKTSRKGTTSPDAQARRGIALQIVREGAPLQVQALFSTLEASGDIGPDEQIIQDDIDADEILLEMDADIDLADEDAPPAEEWTDDGILLSDADASDEPSTNPFSAPRFELVVSDAGCSVPMDEWRIRSAGTPLGQQVLYEMETRLWTLMRIASWLTERRGEFLRTRDLWALGCDALADVKSGQIPVQQKSYMRCAGLTSRVSESSLSRYIRSTDIAWKDGSGPLDIIFSDNARQIWVANAVRQFIEEGGEKVTAELLAKYQSVKVSRGEKSSLAKMPVDGMDLPTFIQKANMLAGTQWADVIAQYGERMLG